MYAVTPAIVKVELHGDADEFRLLGTVALVVFGSAVFDAKIALLQSAVRSSPASAISARKYANEELEFHRHIRVVRYIYNSNTYISSTLPSNKIRFLQAIQAAPVAVFRYWMIRPQFRSPTRVGYLGKEGKMRAFSGV